MTVCDAARRSATASQWRDELIIPWMSTTGGPLPAIR